MEDIILARTLSIINFLQDENIEEINIPIFQRNYDWQKEQCVRFFQDFQNLIKNPTYKHFLGNIFYSVENDKVLVIDGQQRLTTFVILLIVFYKLISMKPELDSKSKRLIYETEKTIFFNSQQLKLRLKFSSKNQMDQMDGILQNGIQDIKRKNDNISQNFIYFYEEILKLLDNKNKEENIDFTQIYDAIKRFIFVAIRIKPTENISIQKIFETLNSTGLPLKQSDLIRNFLLMNQNKENQNYLYNNYWIKIEDTNNRIEEFFRCFLIYQFGSVNIKINEIYKNFQKYYFNNSQDNNNSFECTELAMKTVLEYSKLYNMIVLENKIYAGEIEDIQTKINDEIKYIIKYLEYGNVVIPFMFYLYDQQKSNIIDYEEMFKILQYTESVLFRRKTAQLSTGGLAGFFSSMVNILNNLRQENPNKSLYDLYVYKINSTINIDNDRFMDAIINFKLYRNTDKHIKFIKNYIFDTIEKYLDGVVDTNENYLTIDHIMPEKPTDKWIYINKNDEEFKNCVNTIGNLLLVKQNPPLNNDSFSNKCKLYRESWQNDEIITTQEFLNKYQDKQQWNYNNIRERGKYLADIMNKIWFKEDFDYSDIVDKNKTKSREPIYSNLFEIDEEQLKRFTRNNNIMLLYKNNESTIYKEILDAYILTIKNMIEENFDSFYERIINNEEEYGEIATQNDNRKYVKDKRAEVLNINGETYYINKNNSTAQKLRNLKKIIYVLNLDQDIVKIRYFE